MDDTKAQQGVVVDTNLESGGDREILFITPADTQGMARTCYYFLNIYRC